MSATVVRHCEPCNAPRKGNFCQKCGTKTLDVPSAWDYPEVPSIDKLRSLAHQVGYAIGVHGTQEKDLDVIAAPWCEDAVGNYDLLKHLAEGMNARIVAIERKVLGRYAATLQVDGWFKAIDISVCPIVREGKSP